MWAPAKLVLTTDLSIPKHNQPLLLQC